MAGLHRVRIVVSSSSSLSPVTTVATRTRDGVAMGGNRGHTARYGIRNLEISGRDEDDHPSLSQPEGYLISVVRVLFAGVSQSREARPRSLKSYLHLTSVS
jgi:hypothetical protein